MHGTKTGRYEVPCCCVRPAASFSVVLRLADLDLRYHGQAVWRVAPDLETADFCITCLRSRGHLGTEGFCMYYIPVLKPL